MPTQWIENKARNTEENASFTKNILVKDHIQKNYFSNKSMAYETSQISFLKNKDLMFFLLQRQSYGSKGNLSAKSFIPDLGALNNNMVLLKEWIGY